MLRISIDDFCWAANAGDLDTVKKYIEENKDNAAAINAGGAYSKNTALCLAAMHNHTAIFDLLLATPGINVDAANQYRYTPLTWAAHEGRTELVSRLLKAGADVNVIATDSTNALIWSVMGGHTEITRLLLKVDGIELDITDQSGETALMWAARGGNTEMVRILLEEGADPTLKNMNNETASMQTKKAEILSLLKIAENQSKKVKLRLFDSSSTPTASADQTDSMKFRT